MSHDEDRIHRSSASAWLMRKYDETDVSSGISPSGFAPERKSEKNIRNANKKFIVTPASKTADCASQLFVANDHFVVLSSLSFSPAMRTNHPIGSQLIV